MCGLFLTTRKLDDAQRHLVEGKLKHRGPDQSLWLAYSAVMALHTRLAIVDPNGSFQPLVDDSMSFTMFNGELFNYKDWADTEIGAMHEAVEQRGRPFSLFNGYYATIHYDAGRNEVRAYRDPMGVMPMWYLLDSDEHLTLCSERQGDDWKELPPCAELRFDIKTKRLVIIRSPMELVFPAVASGPAHLAAAFDKAVERVVLHTDVGYDLALSGGLDSSMILASIFERELPLPQRIITTYFDENEELDRAVRLCQHYGLQNQHKLVQVGPINRPLVRQYLPNENPIKDFAFWRHYNVAKNAVSKVLLCGEGADELGLGYPQNRKNLTQVQAYWRKISWLKSQRAMTLDRVNLAGMACSVEYRVPFLDHDLVRAALSVDQFGKTEFRRIARSLGLPEWIVSCPKYGTEERVNRK